MKIQKTFASDLEQSTNNYHPLQAGNFKIISYSAMIFAGPRTSVIINSFINME